MREQVRAYGAKVVHLNRRNNNRSLSAHITPFQPLKSRQSKSDTQAAYAQIRARILDGRLSPGHPLSPRNLADELVLGHTPVRSAIQRLVVEGLVEVIPRKGTYVSTPTTMDLREIYEVRLGLESTAAYLAALHGATDGLTKTVDELRRLVVAESTDLMLEQRIGWMFHAEMFDAAKISACPPHTKCCGYKPVWRSTNRL